MAAKLELTLPEDGDPNKSHVPTVVPPTAKEGEKVCSCGVVLTNYENIVQHSLQVHYKNKRFGCGLCQSDLATESSLKKHIRNVHFRMEAFECPICKKSIQQRSHLREHVDNVHGGKTALKNVFRKAKAFLNSNPTFYKQVISGAVVVTGFDSPVQAVSTAKVSEAVMEQEEVLKCCKCNILCTSRLHFILHMKEVHMGAKILTQRQTNVPSGTVAVKCPICSIECGDLHTKHGHVQKSHNYVKTLRCGICAQECHSEGHFNAHQQHFHPTSPFMNDIIRCHYCEAINRKTDKHLNHVSECHAFQCPECPKHFNTNGKALQEHYIKAHVTGEWINCPTCGKAFTKSLELKKHQRVAHEDVENELVDVESTTEDDRVIDEDVLNDIKMQISTMKGTFPCKFCRTNTVFYSQERLLDHVVEDHPYRCNFCPNKMVKLAISIRKHFRNHHPREQPYFCKVCTGVFNSPAKLNSHMFQKHTNKSKDSTKLDDSPTLSDVDCDVLCISCLEMFRSLKALSDHVTEEHNYVCEVCLREYKLSDSIRKHCRKEHSDYFTEPIVCCRFCPTTFTSNAEKQAHLADVHGIKISGHKYMADPQASPVLNRQKSIEELSYKCPVCKKNYTNPDSLRKHGKMLHDRHFGFCRDCRMVFTNHGLKRVHMEKMHGELDTSLDEPAAKAIGLEREEWKCPKCAKSYTNPESLRKHTIKSHGLSVRLCQTCTKVFRNRVERDKHVDQGCEGVIVKVLKTPVKIPVVKQQSIKSFVKTVIKCYQCQDTPCFNTEEELKAHCSQRHLYRCPICSFVCTNLSDLKVHLAGAHDRSDEVFDCDKCHHVFDSVQLKIDHFCEVDLRTPSNFFLGPLSHEDVTIPDPLIEPIDPIAIPTCPRSISPGKFHGFEPPQTDDNVISQPEVDVE